MKKEKSTKAIPSKQPASIGNTFDYLKNTDPAAYYYNKFKNENNELLDDARWNEAISKNNLPKLIAGLNDSKNIDKEYYNKYLKYKELADYDTYMATLNLNKYDDTKAITRENGEDLTDRQYIKRVLDEGYRKLDFQIIEQKKKDMSPIQRGLYDVYYGFGTLMHGVANGVLELSQLVYGAGNFLASGVENLSDLIVTGGKNQKNMGTEFLKAFDDKGDSGIVDTALTTIQDVLLDWQNKMYEGAMYNSHFVDANKAYEEGYISELERGQMTMIEYLSAKGSQAGITTTGKWTRDIADAIGYLIPSIIIGVATAGTGTAATIGATAGTGAKVAAKGAAKSISKSFTKKLPQTVFFGQIESSNIKQNTEMFILNGSSIDQINAGTVVVNATIKTAFEYAIEKAMSFLFGGTAIDKMLGMSTKRTVNDISKNLEKIAQKTTKNIETVTKASKGKIAIKSATKTGIDALKEGLEEVAQNFSNDIIDLITGGAFANEANKNMTFENYLDAFIVGVATSAAITTVRNSLTTEKVITKDDKVKLIGGYRALGIREALIQLDEWREALNNKDLPNDVRLQNAEAFGKAALMLGNIFGSYSQERLTAINSILSKYKDLDVTNNANKSENKSENKIELISNTNSSSKSTNKRNAKPKKFTAKAAEEYTSELIKEINAKRLAAKLRPITKETKAKVDKVLTDNADKLEKGGTTKIDNIVTNDGVLIDIDGKPIISEELTRLFKELGIKVAIATDGTLSFMDDDVLVTNTKVLESEDIATIINTVGYSKITQEAFMTVKNHKYFKRIQQLYSQLYKIEVTKDNKLDVLSALLFDRSFYLRTLLTVTSEAEEKEALEFFNILTNLENNIKRKNENLTNRSRIETGISDTVFKKIRNNIRDAIIVYSTKHHNIVALAANENKDIITLLGKDLYNEIVNDPGVIISNNIENIALDDEQLKKNKLTRELVSDRFIKECDRVKSLCTGNMSKYIPFLDTAIELSKSTTLLDRVQAKAILIEVIKTLKYDGIPNTTYIPVSMDDKIFNTVNDTFREQTGVNVNDFLTGNWNIDDLSEEVKQYCQMSSIFPQSDSTLLLAAAKDLLENYMPDFTISNNRTIVKIINLNECLNKKYKNNIDKFAIDLRSGHIKSVGDFVNLNNYKIRTKDIKIEIKPIKGAKAEATNNTISLNKSYIKGISATEIIDLISHEFTHIVDNVLDLDSVSMSNIITGGKYSYFENLTAEAKKSFDNYISKNFSEYRKLIELEYPNPNTSTSYSGIILYRLLSGEMGANSALNVTYSALGFTLGISADNTMYIKSPDGSTIFKFTKGFSNKLGVSAYKSLRENNMQKLKEELNNISADEIFNADEFNKIKTIDEQINYMIEAYSKLNTAERKVKKVLDYSAPNIRYTDEKLAVLEKYPELKSDPDRVTNKGKILTDEEYYAKFPKRKYAETLGINGYGYPNYGDSQFVPDYEEAYRASQELNKARLELDELEGIVHDKLETWNSKHAEDDRPLSETQMVYYKNGRMVHVGFSTQQKQLIDERGAKSILGMGPRGGFNKNLMNRRLKELREAKERAKYSISLEEAKKRFNTSIETKLEAIDARINELKIRKQNSGDTKYNKIRATIDKAVKEYEDEVKNNKDLQEKIKDLKSKIDESNDIIKRLEMLKLTKGSLNPEDSKLYMSTRDLLKSSTNEYEKIEREIRKERDKRIDEAKRKLNVEFGRDENSTHVDNIINISAIKTNVDKELELLEKQKAYYEQLIKDREERKQQSESLKESRESIKDRSAKEIPAANLSKQIAIAEDRVKTAELYLDELLKDARKKLDIYKNGIPKNLLKALNDKFAYARSKLKEAQEELDELRNIQEKSDNRLNKTGTPNNVSRDEDIKNKTHKYINKKDAEANELLKAFIGKRIPIQIINLLNALNSDYKNYYSFSEALRKYIENGKLTPAVIDDYIARTLDINDYTLKVLALNVYNNSAVYELSVEQFRQILRNVQDMTELGLLLDEDEFNKYMSYKELVAKVKEIKSNQNKFNVNRRSFASMVSHNYHYYIPGNPSVLEDLEGLDRSILQRAKEKSTKLSTNWNEGDTLTVEPEYGQLFFMKHYDGSFKSLYETTRYLLNIKYNQNTQDVSTDAPNNGKIHMSTYQNLKSATTNFDKPVDEEIAEILEREDYTTKLTAVVEAVAEEKYRHDLKEIQKENENNKNNKNYEPIKINENELKEKSKIWAIYTVPKKLDEASVDDKVAREAMLDKLFVRYVNKDTAVRGNNDTTSIQVPTENKLLDDGRSNKESNTKETNVIRSNLTSIQKKLEYKVNNSNYYDFMPTSIQNIFEYKDNQYILKRGIKSIKRRDDSGQIVTLHEEAPFYSGYNKKQLSELRAELKYAMKLINVLDDFNDLVTYINNSHRYKNANDKINESFMKYLKFDESKLKFNLDIDKNTLLRELKSYDSLLQYSNLLHDEVYKVKRWRVDEDFATFVDNIKSLELQVKLSELLNASKSKVISTDIIKEQNSVDVKHKITINDEYSITSNYESNLLVKQLLGTEFDKTRMSNTQLDENSDEELIVLNGHKFFTQNALFFDNADVFALQSAAEWFLDAEIDRKASTNNTKKFIGIKYYFLMYIYENCSENAEFNNFDKDLYNRCVTEYDKMTKISSALTGANKTLLNRIEPRKTIVSHDLIIDNTFVTDAEQEKLFDAVKDSNIEEIAKIQDDITDRISNEPKIKTRSFLRKATSVRQMSMLSSPLTWLRNIVSNYTLKYLYKVSDKIGSALTKKINGSSTSIYQYSLTKKPSKESLEFIQTNFVDNGMFDNLISSLSRFSLSEISSNDRNLQGRPTAQAIFAKLVVDSLYNKYYTQNSFNKNSKSGKLLNEAHKFLMKMLSDNKFVRDSVINYFGRMLTETNRDLTNGITDSIMNDLATSIQMGLNDYMHSDNIFNSIEEVATKYGEGVLFAYKMLLPFAATTWNWFKTLIDFTPVGMVKGIMTLANLENSVLKADARYNVADKEKKLAKSQVNPELTMFLAKRRIGSGLIGTALLGLGALLAALGWIDLDDDDYDVPKIRFTIGDVERTIDVSSIFGTSSLLAGAAFVSTIKKKGLTFDGVMKSLGASVDFINTSNPALALFEAFNRSGTAVDKAIDYSENVMLSFIPNLFTFIDKSILQTGGEVKYVDVSNDATVNHFVRFLQKAVAKLPFGDLILDKKRDPFTGNYTTTWYDNFINKAVPYITRKQVSGIEQLSNKLGVTKSELTGEYVINDSKFKVKVKDLNRLNELYGNWNSEDLLDFYNDKSIIKVKDGNKYIYSTYSYMNNEQQKNAVRAILNENATIAKIKAWTDAGNSYYASDSLYRKLIAKGINNVYKGNLGFVEK